MPTNHKESDSDNNPKGSKPNRSKNTPVINLTVNTGANQVPHQETATKKENNQQITITITNPPQDNSHNITANKIAQRSFWVNLSLSIFTLIVVGASIVQSYYAGQSVKLADSTFRAAKFFNDSTMRMQNTLKRESDIAGAKKLKRDTDFINKQKKGVDAQIGALNEAKSEFKKTNQPILQVELSMQSYVEIGHEFAVGEKISNYGNFPIQLIKETTRCIIANKEPNFDVLKNDTSRDLAAKILTKNTSTDPSGERPFYDISPKITKGEYYDMNIRKKFFYLIGEVVFIDLSENKTKKYRFKVKGIDIPTSQPRFNYFYNDIR